jgi:hypothetical protein
MRRIIAAAVFLVLSVTWIQAESDPFFDRAWVFPGFVKHQKLAYEEGEYRYIGKLRDATLSSDVDLSNGAVFANFAQMLYIDHGDIYLVDPYEKIRKAKAASISFDANGFASLRFGKTEIDLIYGSFLFAMPMLPIWGAVDTHEKRTVRAQELQKAFWQNLIADEKTRIGIDTSFLYQPVEEMRVPSSLTETVDGEQVHYGPDFFKYRWVYKHGHVFAMMHYLNGAPPWVEDEPGNGSGLEFEITFKEPVDNIVFLNGFVDFRRKHLYKQNARMKEIRIHGRGFSEQYRFTDQVRFRECQFPRKTEHIRVEVLSVYPGSRWSDMAISGLYVRMPYEKITQQEKQRRYKLHVDFIQRIYAQRRAADLE